MIKGIYKLFIHLFIFFSLSALVSIGGAAAWFYQIWHAPSTQATDKLILISKGTNHNQLARQLYEEGYLPSMWLYSALRFGYTLVEQDSFAPKAGEFNVPAASSYADLFHIINEGRPYQHRLVIIEGMLARDIVVTLNKDDRLSGAILRIPKEGSLAPDTYFFERDADRAQMIARMQQRQELIVAEEWANRDLQTPYRSAQEALIMASIIEKESGLSREQPLIASVFLNRLADDMRLQSDASVLYGMIEAEGRAREVLRSDLETDSPWNTYRRAGLPKTAIGNPGRTAIQAALNPMPSGYYYFVADGKGGHKFAKSYSEHKKNVQAYRRFQAQNKQ